MPRGGRSAEVERTGRQELLRLVLGQLLARRFALVRVPHVGELQRCPRAREQLPECERVAVVVASVVADDDLRHWLTSSPRERLRRAPQEALAEGPRGTRAKECRTDRPRGRAPRGRPSPS